MQIYYDNKTIYIDKTTKSYQIKLERELTKHEIENITKSPVFLTVIEQLIK